MNKEKRKRRAVGREGVDEILPEYDFSRARPNKYASRYAAGSLVVVLEPDVAAVFPSAGNTKGEVTKATVVSGPEELREATVIAVRQWRYKPLDTDFIVTVDVNYKLPAKKEAPKS